MKELGFTKSKNDFCLYVKRSESSLMYVLVHIDDIIWAGNNVQDINNVKSKLMSKFQTGEINYFLGIKITKTENGMFLSIETYLPNVLKRFSTDNCNPVSTPLEVHSPRELDGPCIIGLNPYRELVGCYGINPT